MARRPPPQPKSLGPKEAERPSTLYFSNVPEKEFGYYGEAFYDAARVLVRSIARRRGHKMADVLPVLFLYRHAIELSAKAVILSGNNLMSITGQGKTQHEVFDDFKKWKHRLCPLLPPIKRVFDYANWEWYWPNSEIETFADVKAVFSDLELLDPNSFTFRYPTNLRGERSARADMQFGLTTTINVLDALAEALQTSVFGLDAEYGKEEHRGQVLTSNTEVKS